MWSLCIVGASRVAGQSVHHRRGVEWSLCTPALASVFVDISCNSLAATCYGTLHSADPVSNGVDLRKKRGAFTG